MTCLRLLSVLIAAIVALGAGVSTAHAATTSCGYAGGYPGDDAPKPTIAAWMAKRALAGGIPAELPVMGALVESGLTNLPPDAADRAGYFGMPPSIWGQGAYAGFAGNPELQIQWFIDRANLIRRISVAEGASMYGEDQATWGEWVADVLRPPQELRFRYQLRLDEASGLVAAGCTPPPPAPA